jgi:8-oxo-dGTP diphosphatase
LGWGGGLWWVFVWGLPRGRAAAHAGNHEGTLEWIDRERILELPLWESDRLFLPMVFDADPEPFHGVMPYANGKMVSWSYERS